jgi:serine/threonine protein phosphatase PrpC
VRSASEFLASALMAAHHQIIRYAGERAMLDTPRTTLVAALLQGGQATWVHCGDSRLYLVRGGELVTRTRDHSFAEQQAAGVVRMEQVNRNILFTCLGSPTRPVYDVTGPVTLQQGDKLLLCSDGLWSSLPDPDIVSQLAAKPVADAVPDLVEDALRKGGPHSDNVTAIAVEWEQPDLFESTHGVSTDSISDGVFASTIQSGVLDTPVDDLDDAAIERSIAEINDAIRRSSMRKS